MEYEFELGFGIIKKAFEKENEKDIFSRWLIGGYEREMSLEEFKSMLLKKAEPQQVTEEITEKEILAKVKKILEMR